MNERSKMSQSDSCLTCGGLIMKPGISYGYSGPICHCHVPPKIQRPASEQGSLGQLGMALGYINIKTSELERLQDIEKKWEQTKLDIDSSSGMFVKYTEWKRLVDVEKRYDELVKAINTIKNVSWP